MRCAVLSYRTVLSAYAQPGTKLRYGATGLRTARYEVIAWRYQPTHSAVLRSRMLYQARPFQTPE
eukprot:2959941-Rhodomonas_salina.1